MKGDRERERRLQKRNSHFDGNPSSTNISEGIETRPVAKDVVCTSTKPTQDGLIPRSHSHVHFYGQNEPGVRGLSGSILTLADQKSPEAVRTVMTVCR